MATVFPHRRALAGNAGRAAIRRIDFCGRPRQRPRSSEAIREYGHLAVQLDPLGTPPPGAPELTPEFHGITEADLARRAGSGARATRSGTAADVVQRLRDVYCGSIALEFTHLGSEEERAWFRQHDGERERSRSR